MFRCQSVESLYRLCENIELIGIVNSRVNFSPIFFVDSKSSIQFVVFECPGMIMFQIESIQKVIE